MTHRLSTRPGTPLAGLAVACWLAGGAAPHVSVAQEPSQWDGVYTAEQAARGASLYDAHCASCHGADLNGINRAPAVAGDEFGANWDGATLGELFELLQYSMPQDDPGSLSAEQNADILAHMLQRGGYPAGPSALPPDVETLHTLRFVATRP